MIYICIAAHNEERTAGVLLWKIRQVMSEFQRDYCVLFLDDASTDRTAAVVQPYAQVLPLELLYNEERKGYAASLETLLRHVVDDCGYPRRDVIVPMQADFTEEPAIIVEMVKRVEGGADLVATTASPDGRFPLAHRWLHRALPWLERRYELPENVSDPLSGFRAYRVSVIKKALEARDGRPLLTHDGRAANVELLLATTPHARRIDEVAGRVRYDRQVRSSRLSLWRAARELFGLLRDA